MRVAIVIYCLRGGGAERVGSYLANHLADAGHQVLVVSELGPETDQYALAAQVERAVIGGASGGAGLRKSLRLFGKAIKLRRVLRRSRPDVVLSFMTRSNNLALLATMGTRLRTVIAERNDPRFNIERAGDATLRRLLYRRADLLVAQTATMGGVMRARFGLSSIAVVPNPSGGNVAAAAPAPAGLPDDYILAMGRLARQKGFDVLIRAYAQSRARATCHLVIAGQGTNPGYFEALARELGVGERVHLPGHVEAPFELLKRCRMFVLSSRWEGFPNVLLETMSCGRPVISTILPSGAHDMIEDGESGLLVPVGDEAALAAAIDRLADDRDAAEAMGARGSAAVARFALPIVMEQWRTVLADVVGQAA